MAKSLNQAFIKAYSKERASEAHRKASAESVSEEDPLILRVDTATVPVPEPHMLNPRKKERASVAVDSQRGDSTQEPVSQVAPPTSREVAEPVKRLSDSLRDSIASQMLEASAWEDQRIDAFIGGFPMISAAHAPNPDTPQAAPQLQSVRPAANPKEPAVAPPVIQEKSTVSTSQEAPSPETAPESLPEAVPSPSPEVVPAPSPEATSAPAPKADGAPGQAAETVADDGQNTPGNYPVAEPAKPEPAPTPESLNAPVQDAAKGPAHGDGNPLVKPTVVATSQPAQPNREARPAETPELAAPVAPALSFSEVERAVNDLASERKQHGDIFRLDRPSYSADLTTQAAAQEVLEYESGEESSILESPSATNFELDHAHKTAAARAVEEGLRNARLRIFNPVWEVDSLQWPVVCSELLKQREKSMERVAHNLKAATQEGLQVLAITSPQSGEGRTTVACCLAMLAGSYGLNVAIVDGDIENPTLSIQTNLDVESDWKNAIFKQMPLEEVAVHSIDDQVTLLPLVSPIDQSEMAADDNRIAFMLRELSESFDLVIVDTGHMESTRSLVTSLGEQGSISAVVTVVDHRNSSPQRVEACIRRLQRTGIASIGLVENFAA